jgi:hypothetical protein
MPDQPTVCHIHPATPATHTAAMPASTKQSDGSYVETVPLCGPYARRIAAIGFGVTVAAGARSAVAR